MKICVWVVSTCIPERGEKPCQPSVFGTLAEADAYANTMLRAEWETYGLDDEETGERLPYPGDWRQANDLIAKEFDDGSWGEWEITGPHEIEIADVAGDRVDAERWRALMSSQRMHWMGSAGFRHFNPDDPNDRTMQNLVSEVTAKPGEAWMHFGMEFWDVHQAHGNPKYPDRFERQLLTLYVDTLRARAAGAVASAPDAPSDYLAKFPPEARAHVDRAYQDGFVDGVESERSAGEEG